MWVTLYYLPWNIILLSSLIKFNLVHGFWLWSLSLSFRQRLPPKNVYYYRCPDHRKNYVMSFAFCFDREEDVYQFAYCYPYTYTRLQHYLDNLQKRNMDYFCREFLGCSVVSNKHIYLHKCVFSFGWCHLVIQQHSWSLVEGKAAYYNPFLSDFGS